MKWKQKSILVLTIEVNLHKKKKSYRARWLSNFIRSYGFLKMSIMLGLRIIVKGLTKGL